MLLEKSIRVQPKSRKKLPVFSQGVYISQSIKLFLRRFSVYSHEEESCRTVVALGRKRDKYHLLFQIIRTSLRSKKSQLFSFF